MTGCLSEPVQLRCLRVDPCDGGPELVCVPLAQLTAWLYDNADTVATGSHPCVPAVSAYVKTLADRLLQALDIASRP